MARSRSGIFCVEGEWSPRLDDTKSVRPILDLLQAVEHVDFLYRNVTTAEAFTELVGRWGQKQYERYSVGYFALHGSSGHLRVGRRDISLADLGDALEGRCRGRVLYFASCATLDVEQGEIEAFRRRTGARALAGYTKDVEWLESAAFDVLLLDALSYYRRPDAVANWMGRSHSGFADRLGFVFHYGRPRAGQSGAGT